MGAFSKQNLIWLGALSILGLAIFSFTFFFLNHEQSSQQESSENNTGTKAVLADEDASVSQINVEATEVSFGEPVLIENTRVEGSPTQLIDAMDNYLLFIDHSDHLYFYDLAKGEAFSIADGVSSAAFAQEDPYVMYSVRQDMTYSEDVRYINLEETMNQDTAMFLNDVEGIDSFGYHNGVMYATYKYYEDPDTYYTDSSVLDSFISRYSPEDHYSFFEGTSPVFASHDGKMLTYIPERHAISYLQPGADNPIQLEELDPALELTEIEILDLNANGDYVIVDQVEFDGNRATRFYLPTGEVESFQRTLSAAWIDTERLIVVDEDVLYLYDTLTKDSLPLFEGAVHSFLVDNTIYLQATDMEVYAIEMIR